MKLLKNKRLTNVDFR